MSDQTDLLSNEVTLSAKLESNGLKGAAKSRAIAAFDRLVGNVVDVPSAYIENWAKKVRAKGAGVESLITDEYEAASDILSADANFGQRVAEKMLEKEARKQLNKEEIAVKTIERFETTGAESDSSDDPIDDDWLNFFEGYAENASSERLRDLWADILSGEIRKPGAFCLTTLRVLSEMDAKIAETFEEAMKNALPNGILPRPDKFKNQVLLDLMFLEEVGLLQGVNSEVGIDIELQKDIPTFHTFGGYQLELYGGTSFTIKMMKITRVGQEILSILPPVDYTTSFERALGDKVKKFKVANLRSKIGDLPEGGEIWDLIHSFVEPDYSDFAELNRNNGGD